MCGCEGEGFGKVGGESVWGDIKGKKNHISDHGEDRRSRDTQSRDGMEADAWNMVRDETTGICFLFLPFLLPDMRGAVSRPIGEQGGALVHHTGTQ